jgi:hypothetical protein
VPPGSACRNLRPLLARLQETQPEDLGLDPAHVSDRLIQLGHKRLIPRDALQAFALIESRVQATVESSSFPFLGGIGRFVPNPRLGELTDKLDKLRDEFREATLDFVAGYGPLRENAMAEWREAARHLNGSAERLIATIEQSFPPAGEIAKRFAFETRLFQIAAPDSIRLEVAKAWPKSKPPKTAAGSRRMPPAACRPTSTELHPRERRLAAGGNRAAGHRGARHHRRQRERRPPADPQPPHHVHRQLPHVELRR